MKHHRKRFDRTLYREGPVFIEVLPSGRLDAFEQIQLIDIPERPEWLVCDCCLTKSDRLWIWNHYGFCLAQCDGVPRHEYAAGQWGFCVYCRPLFERCELPVLVARIMTLNSDLHEPGIKVLFATLAQCVYGETIPWESGKQRWHPPAADARKI